MVEGGFSLVGSLFDQRHREWLAAEDLALLLDNPTDRAGARRAIERTQQLLQYGMTNPAERLGRNPSELGRQAIEWTKSLRSRRALPPARGRWWRTEKVRGEDREVTGKIVYTSFCPHSNHEWANHSEGFDLALEPWEENHHGEWSKVAGARPILVCSFDGFERAGGPKRPCDDLDISPLAHGYWIGGVWEKGEKGVSSSAKVSEIRRSLNRRLPAERLPVPLARDAPEAVLKYVRKEGWEEYTNAPAPPRAKEKGWKRWLGRLFSRGDREERCQGGVECTYCGERGWECHLAECDDLAPVWTRASEAFQSWHPGEPAPDPQAKRWGVLASGTSRKVRQHWLWIWLLTLSAVWEFFWAGKREEPWSQIRLDTRWETLMRTAAQVRWARILAIKDEAKREKFRIKEMMEGWLRMGLGLRITKTGAFQRLTFDRG
jgi:hypothetical protein